MAKKAAPKLSHVDAQGRVVQSSQAGGIVLKRIAYEIAFENWRRETDAATKGAGRAEAVASNRDVLETTAIASNKRLTSNVAELRARLSGVALAGLSTTALPSRPTRNLVKFHLIASAPRRPGASCLSSR